MKVHVSKLRYFPVIGQSDLLPVNPEATESIECPHLRGRPFDEVTDAKIASLPCWLVAFKGQTLPQGDVRSDESDSDMELTGAGYKIWHMRVLKFLPSKQNDALQSIIQTLRAEGTNGRFVKPANSKRKFEYSLAEAILRASAVD